MAQQQSLTEEALEVVEEQIDVAGHGVSLLSRVLRNRKTGLVAVAVVAAAGGAFAGYTYAYKKMQEDFESRLKDETEAAQKFYRRINKVDVGPDEMLRELRGDDAAEEAAARAHRAYSTGRAEGPAETEEEIMPPEELALHQKHGVDPRPPVEEVVDVNVFAQDNGVVFDYDAEVPNRTELAPYIITYDEFYENESGYEQAHLVYWDDDDVLVDSNEHPVPDPDKIVGEDHLTRFGYGSKDKNIVFVRNPVIEVDFEIVQAHGSYAEDVLGFSKNEDSIRHSQRRFRSHDD